MPGVIGTLGKANSHFDPNPNGVGDRTTTLRRLLIGAASASRLLPKCAVDIHMMFTNCRCNYKNSAKFYFLRYFHSVCFRAEGNISSFSFLTCNEVIIDAVIKHNLLNIAAKVEFMEMSTPQEKAQCIFWFMETKSNIQAQRNFTRKYRRGLPRRSII